MWQAPSSSLMTPFLSVFYQAELCVMSDCPGSQTLVSARQEKMIPLATNGDHNAAGMMKSVWSCTPALPMWQYWVFTNCKIQPILGSRCFPEASSLDPVGQDLLLWCQAPYHCIWGIWVWKIEWDIYDFPPSTARSISPVPFLLWGGGRRHQYRHSSAKEEMGQRRSDRKTDSTDSLIHVCLQRIRKGKTSHNLLLGPRSLVGR